jgi:hypothetical protein
MPEVACPKCGIGLEYLEAHAGKRMQCPVCKTLFPLPKASDSEVVEPMSRAEAIRLMNAEKVKQDAIFQKHLIKVGGVIVALTLAVAVIYYGIRLPPN